MIETNTLLAKYKQLFILFIPILITQVAMYAMNFFDTTMSGHFSKQDLAGVAIGSSLWFPISTGFGTVLQALTPITAQLMGAKKEKDISFILIQGFYVAFSIAAIIIIVGDLLLKPILHMMQLDPYVEIVAKHYLWALAIGIIPLFIYNVCRSFIDALGMTKISMIITLLSLPLNILLNYLFIFGNFGFPRLGGAGAGFATGITYWIIMMIAICVIHNMKPFSQLYIFRAFYRVSLVKWKEIFSLGVPMGLSTFFEASIFSVVTLFMSKFGTNTIAAHQAAMNFESLLYMLPLSISIAMTITVGYEVGAKRYKDARAYSHIGIFIAILFATVTGMLLFIYRNSVASIYSEDPRVIALTSHFLLYAIFFQWSDAIQAPVQGALRGYKDVHITTIMTFISYWIIGLPLGFMLDAITALGPFAYWIGLISGLGVGAITLFSRLFHIQRKKAINRKKASLA
ncbi:MATE family efflux transporter [Bacillus ginsengihumi]|uniref:Probable multidrug resistance protein NorM n=1 Tax=Heyndrickxia ginsengihumi TaxID=363870 RepID=A0A0A6Y168_9BACI|nr:MATE family efflux transporter [Heyndrickxia ginsengihumi]KHD86042.1 multidrug transporter MatE [Heyndrickxia ginsengihumi]NEY19860.1 MATE family efflux transporter [Heyndrickxia ginsengihumi]